MPTKFLCGTPLSHLEFEMQLIPGFRPRRSGISVSRHACTAADCDCQFCTERPESKRTACPVCLYLRERLVAGCVSLNDLRRILTTGGGQRAFVSRVEALSRKPQDFFKDTAHRMRFEQTAADLAPAYGAALYLLTADLPLWSVVQPALGHTGIRFQDIRLHGVEVEDYALFHAAKDLYCGTGHISLAELADPEVIDDEVFRLIVDAILIRRYGAAIISILGEQQMLSLAIVRADTWKELKLQMPVHSAEMAKVYDELGAIDTSNVRTCIVGANSDVKRLNHALLDKELGITTLKELEFLARKLSGLEQYELDTLDAALELERPKTIGEIVNLSCNLQKFDLLSGVTDEEAMGRHLLKERKINIPDSIADCIAYDQVANGYIAEHPGVFTASSFVYRKDNPLEQVYDGEKLPEPYCDPDGIINVRLNPKGKPNAINITFPAADKRIDAVLIELGVKDLDDCYSSCTSPVPGLLDHLPDYDGLEFLNLACGYLNTDEEQHRLFMAVMEAEVPGSMYELPELADALCQYRLLPENIKTPEDYVRHVMANSHRYYVDGFTADFIDYDALGKALIKENGVALTSFGIVERYDRVIRQLPEELTTLRLFSPLYPQIYTRDGYGDLEMEPEEMSTHELCDYKDEILVAIEKNRLESEGDRGLAVYLRNALLGRKVHAMNPTVEEWDGKLWGVLEVQTHGELSKGELAALTEEWDGQCNDGWGEGFEQREIKIDQGELNVSFRNSSRDFFILPEQELKSQPQQRPGMGMGGLS